jgi:hypothetical protein
VDVLAPIRGVDGATMMTWSSETSALAFSQHCAAATALNSPSLLLPIRPECAI